MSVDPVETVEEASAETEAVSKVKAQTSIFIKRKKIFTIAFLGIIVVFMISRHFANYDVVGGITAVPRAFIWMGRNMIPNAAAMERLPTILSRLFETALVSVAVTVTASICAFSFSLFGTRTMKVNVILGKAVRIVAAVFRSVPEVVWAVLLMFSFGQNILTGFFALFFTTFGMLTRTFIEVIDEVSGACVEALESTGATTLQIVLQGIFPSSISVIVSWVLYMIETNIRAATLIGLLTGTGIGSMFGLFYSRLDYAAASLVVISIVLLVVIIELISNQIRKVIL